MVEANLGDATLGDADLRWADLYEAQVTSVQLAQARSLEDTILPGSGRVRSATQRLVIREKRSPTTGGDSCESNTIG